VTLPWPEATTKANTHDPGEEKEDEESCNVVRELMVAERFHKCMIASMILLDVKEAHQSLLRVADTDKYTKTNDKCLDDYETHQTL